MSLSYGVANPVGLGELGLGNETWYETRKAKVESSSSTSCVKRKEGGEETKVGRVVVFIPRESYYAY